MTKLALDAKGMYTSRAINGHVRFDAEGTECECNIIISNVLPQVHSDLWSVNM